MSEIIVERRFDPPLQEPDLAALAREGEECLMAHGCHWHVSFLSADRHDLVCHFTAPDAQALRRALRERGTAHSIWAATVHDAPDLGEADFHAANVLVARRFEAPADRETLQTTEDAARDCLDLRGVRFVRTFFSLDRMRMLCLYQAPDAEAVREAQREAKMPFERAFAIRQSGP